MGRKSEFKSNADGILSYPSPILSSEASPPTPADGREKGDHPALFHLALALSQTLEFDVNLFFQQLQPIIPYEAAVLYRLKDEGLSPLGFFHFADPASLPCPVLPINNLTSFESFWAAGVSIRVNTRDEFTKSSSPLREYLKQKLPGIFTRMQSQMWTPLFNNDDLVGLLGFGHSNRGMFQEEQSHTAVKIAALAVNAILNGERFSQVQRSAAQEERKALARSLHDAVNQSLFSAGLIAEVLPHVWAKDQEEGKKSLEDLRRLIRGAQAEIRMMLIELRHSKLIDVEIADLLHLLANAFTGRTNIPVVEDIQKDNTLPPDVQTAFYQFCQEALNNIVKHSEASQVHIVYKRRKQHYFLCVRDNGCGFDRRRKGMRREKNAADREVRENHNGFNPRHIPPGHYGLRMMDELANSVGAELRVETRPGQGTAISIHWKSTPRKEGILL